MLFVVFSCVSKSWDNKYPLPPDKRKKKKKGRKNMGRIHTLQIFSYVIEYQFSATRGSNPKRLAIVYEVFPSVTNVVPIIL